MKLIIQIPCYNEEQTLPAVLKDLPEKIEGIDDIEILIIDDGSTDSTVQVAKDHNVDHILRLGANRGLARAFSAGLDRSVELGADIIVNTDGDHQYKGEGIGLLVEPIISYGADMVVGDRQVERIEHFTAVKKLLQKVGSYVVRWTSGTEVRDATSGFRAFSKDAAKRLMVFSSYTYTLETIIQAGKKGMKVVSVPIDTNPKLRSSRLIQSNLDYVSRSAATILRIFLMYEPLRVFTSLSFIPFLMGLVLGIRYLYFHFNGEGTGHIQSVIVAGVLILLSFQTFLLGLLADLIARNRRILEDIKYSTYGKSS